MHESKNFIYRSRQFPCPAFIWNEARLDLLLQLLPHPMVIAEIPLIKWCSDGAHPQIKIQTFCFVLGKGGREACKRQEKDK